MTRIEDLIQIRHYVDCEEKHINALYLSFLKDVGIGMGRTEYIQTIYIPSHAERFKRDYIQTWLGTPAQQEKYKQQFHTRQE